MNVHCTTNVPYKEVIFTRTAV